MTFKTLIYLLEVAAAAVAMAAAVLFALVFWSSWSLVIATAVVWLTLALFEARWKRQRDTEDRKWGAKCLEQYRQAVGALPETLSLVERRRAQDALYLGYCNKYMRIDRKGGS